MVFSVGKLEFSDNITVFVYEGVPLGEELGVGVGVWSGELEGVELGDGEGEGDGVRDGELDGLGETGCGGYIELILTLTVADCMEVSIFPWSSINESWVSDAFEVVFGNKLLKRLFLNEKVEETIKNPAMAIIDIKTSKGIAPFWFNFGIILSKANLRLVVKKF